MDDGRTEQEVAEPTKIIDVPQETKPTQQPKETKPAEQPKPSDEEQTRNIKRYALMASIGLTILLAVWVAWFVITQK